MSQAKKYSDAATPFAYQEMFPLGPDTTRYRKLPIGGVSVIEAAGRRFLSVEAETIRALTREAIGDISHSFRASHLQQLRNILDDPEALANDRFVALDLLKKTPPSPRGSFCRPAKIPARPSSRPRRARKFSWRATIARPSLKVSTMPTTD